MEAVADARGRGGGGEGGRNPPSNNFYWIFGFKKWKHKKVFISRSGIITYYLVQFRYIYNQIVHLGFILKSNLALETCSQVLYGQNTVPSFHNSLCPSFCLTFQGL